MIRQIFPSSLGDRIRHFVFRYNDVALIFSLIASILLQFIPDQFPWKNGLLLSAIYLGVIALILLLLEIKWTIEEQAEALTFRNLSEARGQIIRKVETYRRNKPAGELLELHFVGMKLRAMAPIIHELLTDVKDGKRVMHNTRIVVYYFDPDCFDQLIPPSAPIEISGRLKSQFDQYKVIVESNVRELLDYNDDPFFKAISIKIECHTYNRFPSFWGIGIDKKLAFVGPFIWQQKEFVMKGPQNPCVMVETDGASSQLLLDYHYALCSLYEIWGSKAAAA